MHVTTELRRLATLTVGELRAEYERVAGEPARSNNRPFLIKRIAWRLQAAASGGLTERARTRALELARDQDLRVRPRPEVESCRRSISRRSGVRTGVRRNRRKPCRPT